LICHRNYGPGSDGDSLGAYSIASGDFSVKISILMVVRPKRAETGCVFFARFLFDRGLVKFEPFFGADIGGAKCNVAFCRMAT